MKKIIIAGGKGFLGNQLGRYFDGTAYDVKILTRQPTEEHHIAWDGKHKGAWFDEIDQCDVLINLCGKSVDCRYTAKNRDEILRSRIDSTRVLQQAIDEAKQPPKLWLNASSATIYIHAENYVMTESQGVIGDDFSMTICKKWEHEFFKKPTSSTRKVALRTSIVLGKDGGAFPKMKLITRMGLGGPQGDGQQFMSWIHVYDFCRSVHFIMDNQNISGPINVTAPNPIRNKDFMSTLRGSLGAPFGIPSPKALLEVAAIFLGTETELLLKSRNVYPERLRGAGFEFDFPDCSICLTDLLKTQKIIRDKNIGATAVC